MNRTYDDPQTDKRHLKHLGLKDLSGLFNSFRNNLESNKIKNLNDNFRLNFLLDIWKISFKAILFMHRV